MKKEYSKSEKQLIEAVVSLFVILPNPQLGEKKAEVMKIAYEVLENMINNQTKKSEEDESENEELDDDSLDELIEERISEIIEKSLKL
jgi:competence protein ComGC